MSQPRVSNAIKLGFYLSAYFLLLGLFVPYFPVWMKGRGLREQDIGWILAASTIARVPSSPWFSQWADRLGRRVGLLRWLSLGSCVTFALLYLGHGFWTIFGISVLFAALSAPLLPLSENLILVHSWKHRVDYGRVRVFGSIAFMGSTLLAGWVLDLFDPEWVWFLGMAWWILICGASVGLPEAKMSRSSSNESKIRLLLHRRDFLLALLIVGLVTGSHAVYYGHSANLWRDLGIESDVVGMLWATGVFAEIILFRFQRRWTGRLLPSQLMILGAAGGALRWFVLSQTTDLWLLFPAQCLHASSFAATHLGMLRYLQRYLPKDQFATGQGLYSAIATGLFLGSAFLFTGPMVDAWQLGAYHMATVYCLSALALGIWLRSRKKRKGIQAT